MNDHLDGEVVIVNCQDHRPQSHIEPNKKEDLAQLCSEGAQSCHHNRDPQFPQLGIKGTKVFKETAPEEQNEYQKRTPITPNECLA